MSTIRRCGSSLSLVLAVLVAVFVLAFPAALAFGQSAALTLSQSGTRYAGSGAAGFTGDFGPATTVSLNGPSYIVFDAAGNQYISDTLNNCVRRIDVSGNISTVAGLSVSGQGDTCNSSSNSNPTAAQGLLRPAGLAIDAASRLYIADTQHNCVRMLPAGLSGTANLVTVAGTCGSVAAASVTPAPNGLAIDSNGALYISLADNISASPVNQVVRHTDSAAAANVCLVAGAPSANVALACGNANGVALARPSGLTFDIAGNLFIADSGNNCVREIAGTLSKTAVGRCGNDGSGPGDMGLRNPFGLAFSPMQTLFITESAPDNVVSYTLGGASTTIAGGLANGAPGAYNQSQDGKSALGTPLNAPRGIAFDSFGNFLIADSGNNVTRKLSNNIMFPPTPVGSSSAIFPLTFVVNQNVNLSVSPTTEFAVTSNSCSGAIHLGASLTTCQIFVRFNPTRPGTRNSPLQLSDSLSNNTFTFGLQGTGTGALSLFTPGIISTVATRLSAPSTLTVDAVGNAYVLESGSSPDLRLIPAAGGATHVLLSSGLVTPTAAAQDAAGNTFIADATHNSIARFGVDGSVNTAYITGLDSPQAITIDGFGNLFIAQGGSSHNVIEAYASGQQHIIAGSGSVIGADGVLAGTAKFLTPAALTTDLNGILYIADSAAHLVYAVDKAGYIHEVAGNGTTSTSAPGQATGTALLSPVSLAVDAAGDIYIADKAADLVYVVYASSSNGNNIATVLGTGAPGSLGDGGFSPIAQVNAPLSIAVDGSSNLFVIDSGAASIREISYSNPTVDFGSILVGQTSALHAQNVLNVGTENLNLTTPFATSDAHFTVDQNASNCGTTILSGSLCSLSFSFAPTASTSYNATATLVSNSYNSPQSIQLKGLGRQLITPALNLSTQTEVYGQPFPMGAVFTNAGSLAPSGTVTFSSNGTVLCTLSATYTNGLVTCNAGNTGLNVGTYPVTFTYSGDGNFAPATGTLSLVVTPEPLNELVDSTSRLYGAANPTFTGRLMGVANNDTILVSYSSTATATSTIGVYPITATLTPVGTASLSNYTVVNVPGSLTVNPAPLTISVVNASRIYGSANPTFTSSTGTTANGDTFTVTYTTAANLTSPVGTYPITATANGAAAINYTLSVVPGTLSVTPAPLTATVNNATRAYGQPNPVLSSRLNGVLNGDTFTEVLSTPATNNSPVGTYPINDVISGAKASNYTVTVIPGTLSVTLGTLGLSIPAENEVYGQPFPETVALTSGLGAAPTGTFTFTSGGKTLCSTTGTFASAIATCNAAASGLNAGTYTVSVSYSGDSHYAPATGNTVLVVSPATLTVKANDATRAYATANPAFTGSISGLVAGDNVTATYASAAVLNSPVGTYAIVPTAVGATANYTVVLQNGTLTITPNTQALVVDVNNAARIFGTPNPAFTGVVTGMMPGDNVTVTYTTVATTMSNTGDYSITATLSGAAAANYVATVHPGMLAVSPAGTVTAVATSGSPADTGSAVTLTATVTTPVGTPAGIVTFTEGSAVLGTGTLNSSGVATMTTSTLSLGKHAVTATFAATTNFLSSSASLNQVMQAPVGSFTLSASPASQYIHGAGSTVYQVTLTAVGAFNGPVALTCNGLPADATCTFANSTPSLANGGTVTTTMTVTNTAADAKMVKPSALNPRQLAPITAAAVFPVELPVLGIFFAGARRRRTLGPQRMRILLIILFTIGVLGLTGCGCPATAYKTYTINITANSTTFPAPAQTTSVLLSVGQPQ